MIVCIPVTTDGQVAPGWGRADRVALAEVVGAAITGWQEIEVGWNRLHDEGGEGAHHARVVRFLRENQVNVVVATGMGQGMVHTLGLLGLPVRLGADGDARSAVLAATSEL